MHHMSNSSSLGDCRSFYTRELLMPTFRNQHKLNSTSFDVGYPWHVSTLEFLQQYSSQAITFTTFAVILPQQSYKDPSASSCHEPTLRQTVLQNGNIACGVDRKQWTVKVQWESKY